MQQPKYPRVWSWLRAHHGVARTAEGRVTHENCPDVSTGSSSFCRTTGRCSVEQEHTE